MNNRKLITMSFVVLLMSAYTLAAPQPAAAAAPFACQFCFSSCPYDVSLFCTTSAPSCINQAYSCTPQDGRCPPVASAFVVCGDDEC